jgi:quercetin dioxygenase-like cupin family protein
MVAAMTESDGARAHEFAAIDGVEVMALMDGVRVRQVNGERITLAVMELDPVISLPEHSHPNEQVGIVLRGEFTFTIGGETRLRKPGDMWVIPPGIPHTVERTGAAGCTILETFSPPRADWADKPRTVPAPDLWPPS